MGKRVSQRIVQHIGVAFDQKELAELVRITGKSYRFPKQLSGAAKKIYRSFGIKHSTSVKEILSKKKYRNRIKYLDSES